MTINLSWFECLFERENNERRVVKCLEMIEESATKKGEGYTCQVNRITLQVELGSGDRTHVSFVVKRIPEKMKDFFREHGFFTNEIIAYSILNQMERFMKSIRDPRKTLWCQLKGHTDNAIIFEDLGAEGYKCINKVDMANKEESICAVTELARFHALGLAVINQNSSEVQQLMQKSLIHDEKLQKMFLYAPVMCFRDAVKNKWGPEWSDTGNFLDQIVDNIGQILNRIDKTGEEFLKVISHGDFWTGNIMYARDFHGNILSTKFIDFQFTSLNSFAYDLCFFLYGSVKFELLSDDLHDELVRAYHDNLISNMKFFQLDLSKVPSLQQVKSIMESLRGFALLVMCMSWPFLAEEFEVDLSGTTESKGEGKDTVFQPFMYESDETKNILGAELRKLMEKGKL